MRPILTSTLLACGLIAAVAAAPQTPKPGSPERKAILEALRVPVQRELKKPVVFKVDHLRVRDGWAFMTGVPQQPGGKKMDYRGTKWSEAIRAGAFDDWVCALLRKRDGKWRVVDRALGATDVVWDGWHEKHRAPRALFPYPQ